MFTDIRTVHTQVTGALSSMMHMAPTTQHEYMSTVVIPGFSLESGMGWRESELVMIWGIPVREASFNA